MGMLLTKAVALADVQIVDAAARATRLGALWGERPIVLAWMRHFGCTICMAHVTRLCESAGDVRAAGGELVVIGHGAPEQAAWFVEEVGVSIPVYTDPSLRIYSALATHPGFRDALHPGTFWSAMRAMRRGLTTQPRDDAEAAVAVIAPDGSIRYGFVSRFRGDEPDLDEVLAAVRTGGTTGSSH
jgi:peroxiredoxin